MICGFCGEDITVMSGTQSVSHIVHHINGNRKDVRPENELDCHYGCHNRHHINERIAKDPSKFKEMWRKIGLANKGRKRSDETIERMCLSQRRRRERGKISDITRERMSDSHIGLRHSEETRRRMRVSHRERRERDSKLRGILVAF